MEELWKYFVESESNCNSLGLLLAKNNFDYSENSNTTNFGSITGKLEELLPDGINTIYDDQSLLLDSENSNKFLVLAGNYPQPGWGIFITAPSFQRFIQDIEKFLMNYLDLKDMYEGTRVSYKHWKIYNTTFRISPESKKIKTEKNRIKEIIGFLKPLCASDANLENSFDLLKKYFKANTVDFETFTLETISGILSHYNSAEFKLAMLVNNLSRDNSVDETYLMKVIERFINEHNNEENNLFHKLANEIPQPVKRLISFILDKKIEINLNESIYEKYTLIYNNKISEIVETVKKAMNEYAALLGKLDIDLIQIEEDERLEFERWETEKERSRLVFKAHLEKTLEYQTKNSYKFLVDFESAFIKHKYKLQSFSWDPPRMIGWKLLAHGTEIYNCNISVYIKENIPEFENYIHDIENLDVIDGNTFTDYIHYYSIKKNNLTIRDATKLLLNKILKPSDLIILNKKLAESNQTIQNNGTDTIENILVQFGWPLDEDIKEVTLSQCINKINGTLTVPDNLDGNKVRKVLESYCKDLIDVIVSKLNYSLEELNDSFGTTNWTRYIEKIMLGDACKVLANLLNKCYTEKKYIVEQLMKEIQTINSKQTNPDSHHNPGFILDRISLAESIQKVINLTHELIAEMPWHFKPIQKNGVLPVVLTGNVAEKQISFIIWDNSSIDNSMLIWNPDKKNPVMPNSKPIRRP